MKNGILVIVLGLASTFAASAQSSKFRLGIFGSGIIGFVSTDHQDASGINADGGAKLFGAYGATAEWYFAERYAITTGFEIIRRGGTLDKLNVLDGQGNLLNVYKGDYSVGFVQLPFALMMRTREIGYFTYYAQIGGVLAFRTGETVSYQPGTPSNNELKNYSTPVNALFRFGLGTEYSLGETTALQLGLYYNRSLIDNLRSKDFRLEKQYNYRYDYVSLRLGIIF